MSADKAPRHPTAPTTALSYDHVVDAHQRIASMIEQTPILTAPALDEALSASIFFKCEHLQKTGSFKFRGASHAVSHLDEHCPGVATHSSGNHGAALALAAQRMGIPARVVMPQGAIQAKVDAVGRHGGVVEHCAPSQHAREAGLARWVAAGWWPIPPYDHPHIIAGQGTLGLELMRQVDALDVIISPIGGGGLISGIILAAQGLPVNQRPRIVGVEPSGADDTYRSIQARRRISDHQPDTIADGLRALVGELNFEIIQRHIDDVICVSEASIVSAMTWLWEDLKQVIEPSGAVALAGVLKHPERFAGQRVGVVLSGGNLDLPSPLIDAA